MKVHEAILSMIEEVNPDDTTTLDKINILTLGYIAGADVHIIEIDYDGSVYAMNALREEVDLHRSYNKNEIDFTRSRDALKAIRPEGWYLDHAGISYAQGGFSCTLWRGKDKELIYSDPFLNPKKVGTEELAELHAIIQAIAYERSQNDSL